MEPVTARQPAHPPPGLRPSDEDGAQAVEYAMIGGVGAGLIGLLWTIITRTGLVDRIVETLLTSLVELISSWF